MAKTKQSRLLRELTAMAGDMRRLGILSKTAHEKITKRHLGAGALEPQAISASEIKTLRVRAQMSQAVFTDCLNLTAGYVSQLERGDKRPTGPALVLLNVIKRKGIGAIL